VGEKKENERSRNQLYGKEGESFLEFFSVEETVQDKKCIFSAIHR
jgi:hypothetical protein